MAIHLIDVASSEQADNTASYNDNIWAADTWGQGRRAGTTGGAEGDTRTCRQGLEICRHLCTQQAV